MLRIPRQQRLLATVERNGFASYLELASQLGVSAATVRRDAADLARTGLVVGVRGGARTAHAELAHRREDRARGERSMAMAHAAADLVEAGMIVGLLGSGPLIDLARLLGRVPGLTVVTNSLDIASEFSNRPAGPQLIFVSGEMNPDGHSVGALTTGVLYELSVDILFYADQGFDDVHGFTSRGFLEAEVVRAFAASARRVVALFDSAMWRSPGFVSAGRLSMADVLITDGAMAPSARDRIQREIADLRVVLDAPVSFSDAAAS
jgi:DeoR/GlpR family transcriptional regulator of sugar metabolism